MNNKPLKKREIIKIFKSIKILKKKIQIIDIKNSIGRILAEDLLSTINVPPFNNSAVDGYAIKDSDLSLKKFRLIGRIVAGDNKNISLKSGEAVRIFTGARMPKNSNTVVMQENSKEKDNFVSFLKLPNKNDNCRFFGEDIKKDLKILSKGDIIKTNNQSLIASIGLKKIKVYEKLKIGFFTSGNELRNPKRKISGSQIYNSNRYALFSLIKQSGFDVKDLGALQDNEKKVKLAISNAIKKFDILITTGGASVGDEDYLIDVIDKIGKIIFWKAAIKPGRPLAFGYIKKKPIICLPGNPVSVFLLFAMLIKSFLYKCNGSKWYEPIFQPAKINFNMKKKTNRMEWLRVKINKDVSKEIILEKYPKQGSGIISSIAFSDGIIEIPENVFRIKTGDIYKFYSKESLF